MADSSGNDRKKRNRRPGGNGNGRARRMSGEERREQIVRSVLKLAEGGLKAVTVASVAQDVGLVPSALYRHFGGRDDMVRAAFAVLRGELEKNLTRALTESSALEGMEKLLARQMTLLRAYPAMPRLIFSDEVLAGDNPLRLLMIEAQDRVARGIAAVVARGQELGEVRGDLSPADLAVIFMGQLLMPLHMKRLRRGEYDLEGQVERNWLAFRRLLVGPEAAIAMGGSES